ncbi:MAG: hypothetical protein ACYC9L_12730, partial [Sulfuricaulis sp.]
NPGRLPYQIIVVQIGDTLTLTKSPAVKGFLHGVLTFNGTVVIPQKKLMAILECPSPSGGSYTRGTRAQNLVTEPAVTA